MLIEMSTHQTYRGPKDCPAVVPLFPLAGALLLPRGQLPLNIFEPRYVAMIDEAIATHRVIGMIQPDDEEEAAIPRLYPVGCAGRITQFAEAGDGRYVISLTGVSRFRVVEELTVATPYRQARVDYEPFKVDFEPRAGEAETDRAGVIRTLREFAEANDLKVDWKGINEAPNEALVNALSMMSPFGPREKQALLEAPDLKSRAEMLIAITEIELVRESGNPDTTLQ
ncbi:Lon N-terminal domain-containing protein [Chelatococcus asaccharovorans]|nr:Lon N-terminal domain-containing protein [Chelatococcus asaccharovorans]CAH1684623.1 Lon N-terminal domain-containing protein [Chelatococcus asaccharovorans]